MILQVKDIIIDAMGLIGAVEIDETPTSSEMATAIRTANIMIGRWSSQRLLLRSTDTLSFTTTAGKPSYTVGSTGADITASKPLSLQSGFITDYDTDYPLYIIPHEQYNTFPDKEISQSRPEYVAYTPNDAQQSAQKGTLYLYFNPDKAYSIKLEVDSYLTEFVNLTDTVTFEPAYYEALIYNLAVRLFRRYHSANVNIPQDIAVLASKSLDNLRTLNSSRVIASMDTPMGFKAGYDVYTDT